MSTPRAPAGAGEAGRKLWRAVLGEFELAEHELALLRQAVHVADTCQALKGVVDAEGSCRTLGWVRRVRIRRWSSCERSKCCWRG
jgi:hypothetical protein